MIPVTLFWDFIVAISLHMADGAIGLRERRTISGGTRESKRIRRSMRFQEKRANTLSLLTLLMRYLAIMPSGLFLFLKRGVCVI